MNMTQEQALKLLEYPIYKWSMDWDEREDGMNYTEAIEIAIAALRPVSREQVEKVWRGEWEDMREAYKDVPKRRCSRCKNVFIGLDTPFCEVCGAPMTDEAVDMVMERLKEVIPE